MIAVMASAITPADPFTLIPPLLACLPTSFASSKPPPALLQLLSPILRQRVHLHCSDTSDPHESWIRLLCWDGAKVERLKDVVESANFEPHPVSGELEVGDVDAVMYKRFDHETIKSHIPLSDWDLSALYLWCTGNEDGDGWRLTELLPIDSDVSKDSSWFPSLQQAEEAARQRIASQAAQAATLSSSRMLSVSGGDDDDYWAMYDNAPSDTPARKPSVNPAGTYQTEDDYYARYGNVQPALDSHDPDEENPESIESGLNGNALQQMLSKHSQQPRERTYSSHNADIDQPRDDERIIPVRQPTPSSPRSRAGSDMVEKLENQAEKYAASEIGIRHHIGYSIKSMYRLAKSTGISRQDFEDMIQRELDTLSILDRDD